MQDRPPPDATARRGTPGEVFRAFLVLGLTSFGGPVAHLGYFRTAFVARRGWLSESAYADLIALCQFLPGPASSQVGMAIGLSRAGYLGMLAAFAAFTLPSAIALVAFAYGLTALGDTGGAGWIAGLKAAAVAVVAHALLGMARTLTPDAPRATIAAGAMILLLVMPAAWTQVLVIVLGALAALLVLPKPEIAADPDGLHVPVGRGVAIAALAAFAALLVALPILAAATDSFGLAIVDRFYRAGSLVFGGGHVVLPLLEQSVVAPGLVTESDFLAGYGAAQAVPGPLFTFAAFLGAVLDGPLTGVAGATLALLAIFLPSALLVLGALPFWSALRSRPNARRALAGVNAAVVGLLAAALYDPVFTKGITSPLALAIAVAAFVALAQWKAPPWAVVTAAGVVGGLVL